MVETTKLPKEIEPLVGKLICRAAKHYFENGEHRRAFEEWYLKTYGKPYEWERRVGCYG